jgi:hypothetical protein
MPDDQQNFEPYIDWNGLTDEMAWDLVEKLVPYKLANERLIKQATRRWRKPNLRKMREATVELLQLQSELGSLNEAIIRTLVTIPMMIHVAGPKTVEECDSGTHNEHRVQRCARCGSVLQMWQEGMMHLTPAGPAEVTEEEISWWTPGTLVAKSGSSGPGLSMYEVEPEGRELEKHEMVCVDLNKILT